MTTERLRFRCLLGALLLAGAASARAHDLAAEAAIQWLGDFHGDEVVARDGERWLALRADGKRAWLEPVSVTVRPVRDELLDAPGATSGRRVELPAPHAGALVLLRGAALAAGPLPTAVPGPADMAPRSWRRIEARGLPSVALQLQCDEPFPPPPHAGRCTLQLDDGSQRQALHAFVAGSEAGVITLGDDGSVELRFAGDLDGDARLDLLLDVRDHYNVRRTQLWLSRGAPDGALLRLAAQSVETGC